VGGWGDRRKKQKREPAKEERERTQPPPDPQPDHPAKEREARERKGKEEEGGEGCREAPKDVKRRETAPGPEEEQALETEDSRRKPGGPSTQTRRTCNKKKHMARDRAPRRGQRPGKRAR
jgi:hypothetical protein